MNTNDVYERRVTGVARLARFGVRRLDAALTLQPFNVLTWRSHENFT